MADTQTQSVSVVTMPVTGHELGTGHIVVDGELIDISMVDRVKDPANVILLVNDRAGRSRKMMTSRDMVFHAVVWPACLANDAPAIRTAQITRAQLAR